MNRIKLTAKKKALFLQRLAAGDTIVTAAAACGVTSGAAHYQRAADPAFAAAWEDALEAGTQVLEQEAMRRAVHGTEKLIVSAGRVMGTELQHSDTLLIFLLKARRPSVYRDTINVEHYIRQAAIDAGVDPDAAVAEAQAIVKEAKAAR